MCVRSSRGVFVSFVDTSAHTTCILCVGLPGISLCEHRRLQYAERGVQHRMHAASSRGDYETHANLLWIGITSVNTILPLLIKAAPTYPEYWIRKAEHTCILLLYHTCTPHIPKKATGKNGAAVGGGGACSLNARRRRNSNEGRKYRTRWGDVTGDWNTNILQHLSYVVCS